jgi:energy-converting hydrogenase Eha subunit F
MLLAAKELADIHGTFFAAAFLADLDIPIEIALDTLIKRAVLQVLTTTHSPLKPDDRSHD